jgi:hypothetical protein
VAVVAHDGITCKRLATATVAERQMHGVAIHEAHEGGARRVSEERTAYKLEVGALCFQEALEDVERGRAGLLRVDGGEVLEALTNRK